MSPGGHGQRAPAGGIGSLKTEADLLRWLKKTLRRPDMAKVLLAGRLPDLDQYGYSVLRHGVKGGPLVAADQSSALAALVGEIIATGKGGTALFPATGGVYTVNNGFTIPENAALTLRGDGSGWRSSFGRATTLLRRVNPAATNAAMVRCSADGMGDTDRALARLRGLRLSGGANAGVTDGWGVLLQGSQEGNPLIDDVRLEQFPGRAALLANLFNCSIDHLRATHSGSSALDAGGQPQEAVRVAGTSNGGTVTVNGYDWQFEQNNWTDLRLGGEPDFANGYVTEFNLFGAKFEGGIGVEAPYLHYAFCELSNLYGIGIFCHRSVPPILVEHMKTGSGEDQPVNHYGWITQAPGVTPPDYYIDIQGGNLHYHGGIRGRPGVAHVRIGANVRPGNFSFDGQVFDFDGTNSTPTKLLVEDNRSVKEF